MTQTVCYAAEVEVTDCGWRGTVAALPGVKAHCDTLDALYWALHGLVTQKLATLKEAPPSTSTEELLKMKGSALIIVAEFKAVPVRGRKKRMTK